MVPRPLLQEASRCELGIGVGASFGFFVSVRLPLDGHNVSYGQPIESDQMMSLTGWVGRALWQPAANRSSSQTKGRTAEGIGASSG